MTFGQQSGPPASSKQVHELLTLLHEAGHSDFKDGRGPMGFSQRQAAGKFTRDEADAFIAQLQQPHATDAQAPTAPTVRISERERSLRSVPDALLLAEVTRRGWKVSSARSGGMPRA
ncbi:MAG: hypothetical protein NVS3B21_05190 [Acidimicrobiales bacterium]